MDIQKGASLQMEVSRSFLGKWDFYVGFVLPPAILPSLGLLAMLTCYGVPSFLSHPFSPASLPQHLGSCSTCSQTHCARTSRKLLYWSSCCPDHVPCLLCPSEQNSSKELTHLNLCFIPPLAPTSWHSLICLISIEMTIVQELTVTRICQSHQRSHLTAICWAFLHGSVEPGLEWMCEQNRWRTAPSWRLPHRREQRGENMSDFPCSPLPEMLSTCTTLDRTNFQGLIASLPCKWSVLHGRPNGRTPGWHTHTHRKCQGLLLTVFPCPTRALITKYETLH